MGRFSRLVELRRLREEADGLAYSRILGRIESFRQKIGMLEKETAEGQEMAVEMVKQGQTPGAVRMDDFFRGQSWRVKKLEDKISMAQVEANSARLVWLAARTQLKQAEKMAEKERLQHDQTVRRNETKELDMIGIVQNQFRP
ncbi:MAG: flagellar export protein FliJ [Magnetococcales bacterium]|nr:flagellar export protein FliJ [Magnetococcales bacterium]